MKLLLTWSISIFCCLHWAAAQDLTIRGKVVDESTASPLIGVTIIRSGTDQGTVSDDRGTFEIQGQLGDKLTFSYIGYKTQEIAVANNHLLTVQMSEDLEMLGAVEVYATGYQQISPEKATGSFVQIDQNLLQRSTGTNILNRLENVTPGLLFDKRQVSDTYGSDYRKLRIRGINSIESDNSPLIVVDNFPYDGDLSNINPNDVKTITVLRDAAAASIWGAQAANGVIVITLKEGRLNQPMTISLTNNITFGQQPDLHYSPEFIEAEEYMELEKTLFDKGFYNSDETSLSHPAISPVVELLIQEREGRMSEQELEAALARLSQNDVRDEVEKHFYRQNIHQQHAVSISAGGEKSHHYLSAGFDKQQSNMDGNDNRRISVVSNNTFKPIPAVQIDLGINITNQQQDNNGFSWRNTGTELPYNKFTDESGNWAPVMYNLSSSYIEEAMSNGYLDWYYRPLQEKSLKETGNKATSYRLNTAVSVDFLKQFQTSFRYQFQQTGNTMTNLQDKNSYYVRHQVNRFTQEDGTQLFPHGDILTRRFGSQMAHAGRLQLNYQQHISVNHALNALAGIEIRQTHTSQNGSQLFNYNDKVLTYNNQMDYTSRYPVNPRGSSYLPQPSIILTDITDRYLSYFGNVSYTIFDKYILSASARYDASNLFGVKTNQKGVPLWSVGASWDISQEDFFKQNVMTYLRLRTTYGHNGNINKSVTAYPTATYTTDWNTGLPMLILNSPGNPQLRWETVSNLNLALDFKLWNNCISGTIEYFRKHGHDIIGARPLDPTSGATLGGNLSNKINYAETLNTGWDFQFQSHNIRKGLNWTTNYLVSIASNKIVEFANETIGYNDIRSGTATNNSSLPQEGKSIDGIYSIPWHGLDPNTGDLLLEVEGLSPTDYREYVRNITMDQLIYHGSLIAPIFGAVRNNLEWKDFGLSINVSWKANYYFRKSALDYDGLFDDRSLHRDFKNRWQSPGDEQHTNVPSMPEEADTYRDFMYTASELHVEKGDHIRLEDVNANYTFSKERYPGLPFSELKLFVYAKNLGILWQASKSGLDPDIPNASYRIPRSYAIGLNATF